MNNSKNKAIFLVVTVLFWFALYTYVPVLSPFAESLGASHKLVGLIAGSYGFTQMVLRIPLGIVSDKLRKRKEFVILGVFFGATGCLGMYLLPYPIALLIFRSMAGVSAAAWVAYTVLFSGYYSEDEAPKAIGLLMSVATLAQSSGNFFGGTISQFYGIKAAFLLGAAGGLVGLALSFTVSKGRPVEREPLKLTELLRVMTEPGLMIASVLAILSQYITFSTIYGFTPIYAGNLGASNFQLGLLTTLSTLPSAVTSALNGPVFMKYLGEKKTIATGFFITLFTSISIPYTKSIPLLFITQILGGFGRGMVFPMLMGLSIKNVEENKRATAMGFFQAVYSAGMFIGPLIVGFISDMAGLAAGFWSIGLVSLTGAVLTLFLINNRKKSKQENRVA